MTQPTPGPGAAKPATTSPGTRELSIGPDAVLRLAPADVEAVSPQPDAPDVARLPGARLALFELVRAGEATLQVGCVRAPSDRWVPGLESLVFERALGLALAPTGLAPRGLERAPRPDLPGTFATDRWSGFAGEDRSLEILSILAFVGEDADALACTVLCVEPRGATTAGGCAGLVDRTELTGELVAPPPPGLGARALLWSAEQPLLAAVIAAASGLAIVAGALATRPRRRPTASRGPRGRSR